MTAGETRRKRGGLCRTAALAAIFLSLSKPVHSGWVDPDTPPAERMTQALTAGDNRQFGLVRYNPVSCPSMYPFSMMHRYSRTSSSKTDEPLTTVTIHAGQLSTRTTVSSLVVLFLCAYTDLLLCDTDTNQALHFYSPKNAITTNGVLNLTASLHLNKFKAYKKNGQVYVGKKHIQSAMIQGWNKFCFTGGIVEFSAKLPGSAHTGGLWPACTLTVAMI